MLRVLAAALTLAMASAVPLPMGATIIVVGVHEGKTVIAADSFERQVGDSPQTNFTSCKISAVGLGLFAATGLAGADEKKTQPPLAGWSTHLFAMRSFRARRPGEPLNSVAERWAVMVETALRLDFRYRPETAIKGVEKDGSILTGLFAETGKVLRVPIKCENYPRCSTLIHEVLDAMGQVGVSSAPIAMQGDGPAQEEIKRYLVTASADANRFAEFIGSLVSRVVASGKFKGEIGGPTDIVELTSQGVRWIARKPNCPAQN
jgi:hypothetical protein